MTSQSGTESAPQIEQNFIQTDRMRFHYRAHGDADGMPMVLVHGSFGSSSWWEPMIKVLPAEIRAFAPDLRGTGQSDRAIGGYTIPEQAADLHAFIQALNLSQIDLVAHSSGGAIAVELALDHPELISTLTLVDSVPVEGIFTPVDTLMVLEQMKADEDLLRQSLMLLMPTLDHEQADHALFEKIVSDAQHMSPELFTAVAEALGQWNRFAEASQLVLPSLIVWGELDEIVSRDATTRTLIALPGANNLEVLRGVGHSPMLEAPLTLAEKIIDFITEDYRAYGSVRDSV